MNKNPFMAFDFSKLMSSEMPQWVDSSKLLELHQKNMDALTAANKSLVDGAEALIRRESELFSQNLARIQTMAQECARAGTTQDKMGKQIEVLSKSFEEAFANLNELGQIVAKSNSEAFEVLQQRFQAAVSELQDMAVKMPAAPATVAKPAAAPAPKPAAAPAAEKPAAAPAAKTASQAAPAAKS